MTFPLALLGRPSGHALLRHTQPGTRREALKPWLAGSPHPSSEEESHRPEPQYRHRPGLVRPQLLARRALWRPMQLELAIQLKVDHGPLTNGWGVSAKVGWARQFAEVPLS